MNQTQLVADQFRQGFRNFPFKRGFLPVDVSAVKARINSIQVPPLARKKSYNLPVMEILTDPDEYTRLNYVTDIYTEELRLSTRVSNYPSALEQWWERLDEIIAAAPDHTDRSLRETMYDLGIHEATQFKISTATIIYKYCGGKSVLDPCAGWGDRHIAALSLGLEYTGCDPNRELAEGHQEIARDFGGKSRMYWQAFEDVNFGDQLFDTVFTSPPYHDYEDYSPDDQQSARRYYKYGKWLQRWYAPAVTKMARLLRPGGYLALHAGSYRDQYGTVRRLNQDTLRIMRQIPSLKLEIVALSMDRKIPIPVFVARKI